MARGTAVAARVKAEAAMMRVEAVTAKVEAARETGGLAAAGSARVAEATAVAVMTVEGARERAGEATAVGA